MKNTSKLFGAGVALCMALGCGSDGVAPLGDDANPVILNYAQIVAANYAKALEDVKALRVEIDAFAASPTANAFSAARNSWRDARESYGQTEAFRFYDGPIDNPTDGPEGQINAWPLDEGYIDYVVGNATSGIINNPTTFPTLSKELLAAQNEQGGETNIATGYHAIEFLLWGQDFSTTGAGARAYTDFVEGPLGTAENQSRRLQYLKLAVELLVDDLTKVSGAWNGGASNYRAEFVALDPKEAVRRMLLGMGSLAGAELSGERMSTAYDNQLQEDEHSCFSDNTHRDLHLNALAVQNVYLGNFGTIEGPGLDGLVRARDEALDDLMKQQLAASIAAIEGIPVPFDQAILSTEGRPKVLAAIHALQAETATIVEIATLLGIQINLE